MLIETRGNDGRDANIGLYEAILKPVASFNGLWSLKNIPQISIDDIKDLSYNDLTKYIFKILGADSSLLCDALFSYKTFDNPNTPLDFTKLDDDLFLQK